MRILAFSTLLAMFGGDALAAKKICPPYLDHEVRKLRSSERMTVCDVFAGKPGVVANTASHCGFTDQFAGLAALHRAYRNRGLEMLGVPSNDFRQAAAHEEAAARVCYINYGVTFTILPHQHVQGAAAHPLFRGLARRIGALDWNFNKNLLDRDGDVIKRIASGVEPMSQASRAAIEALL